MEQSLEARIESLSENVMSAIRGMADTTSKTYRFLVWVYFELQEIRKILQKSRNYGVSTQVK